MTGQYQRQLVFWYATTIIDNPDQAFTTLLKCDLNRLRARIQAIFNQFFHHRRWSFNNLTGGDLINQEFW